MPGGAGVQPAGACFSKLLRPSSSEERLQVLFSLSFSGRRYTIVLLAVIFK
jgi:hypothetical protein